MSNSGRAIETKTIKIRTEKDAIDFLKSLKRVTYELGGDQVPIRFQGWEDPVICLGGEHRATLNSATIEMLHEYQRAIYRCFSIVVYGEPTARKLTAEQRKRLDLTVRVREGSTPLDFKVEDVANKFIEEALGKMTNAEIAAITILVVLLLFSGTVFALYLKHLEKVKHLDVDERKHAAETKASLERQAASDAHAEQVGKIIQDAIKALPRAGMLNAETMAPKEATLKAIESTGDSVAFGVTIPRARASALSERPRRTAVPTDLVGLFQILVVDRTSPEGIRVKVFRAEDQLTFYAFLSTKLSQKDFELVSSAEWSNREIELSIVAHKLGDEVTRATVHSVREAAA